MFPMPLAILSIEDESDREWMEYIFRTYQRLMYYEIVKIVKDPWTAEDILQTTVVNLIDKLETVRKLRGRNLVNYLISASKNTAISHIRASQKKHQLPLDDWSAAEQQVDHHSPELLVLQNEDLREFARVWNQLDERSQLLLRGRYILKQSYAELAEELHIKPESVRMAVTRAKRTARDLMKKSLALK